MVVGWLRVGRGWAGGGAGWLELELRRRSSGSCLGCWRRSERLKEQRVLLLSNGCNNVGSVSAVEAAVDASGGGGVDEGIRWAGLWYLYIPTAGCALLGWNGVREAARRDISQSSRSRRDTIAPCPNGTAFFRTAAMLERA